MEQTQALDRNITLGMLTKFSLPTILSTVLMGIYWSVDGIFVSRLVGTDALSAINIVMPIITFSLAIGNMFGAGGNALIAKKLGEGKDHEARQDFALLNVVALFLSLLLSILGLIFLKPLLGILGADEALMGYCRDYAIPILLLIPFSITGTIFQMSFITVGKPKLGLLISLIGGVTNVILDYFFMAVLDLGIMGAAIATSIGYSIPSLVGLIYFLKKRGNLYLVKPRFNPGVIWKACTNGASEMVTSLSSGMVTIILNNILMRISGADGVASITIILYVQGILASVYFGYASGISPIISYNFGKGDTGRLKSIYGISLKAIMATSVATLIASILFAGPLVSIFAAKGSAVYLMAVSGYRIFSVSVLFMGLNVFSSAWFTALNDGKVSAILAFFRTFIFILATASLLPMFLGISGVWLSKPLAEILATCMTMYYFKKMKNVYQYA